MRAPLTYTLRLDISITTKGSDGEEREEVVYPAGTVLAVRRPKAKDLRIVDDLSERPVALALAMITRLTKLEAHEADNLEPEDLDGLGELLDQATPSGQPTGETSSAT